MDLSDEVGTLLSIVMSTGTGLMIPSVSYISPQPDKVYK